MSPLNTLSAGYKSHPTAVEKQTKAPIVQNPTQIDPVAFTNKIKQWHADGNLSTDGVNHIISELQKIV
jgi:hypothetical protein|tara:strand:+ start:211 stop:414 length:204 start_codon:yes stop_codon:yes gene_type:complete